MNPLDKNYEHSLEALSPFEIKNELIKLAQADARKSTRQFLNAAAATPTG